MVTVMKNKPQNKSYFGLFYKKNGKWAGPYNKEIWTLDDMYSEQRTPAIILQNRKQVLKCKVEWRRVMWISAVCSDFR